MLINENQRIWEKYNSKTIIKEGKRGFDLSQYIVPPPRGKFHRGDIVYVRDEVSPTEHTRFRASHSRGAWSYVGKVGTVEGYRNSPGSFSKYAVRFDDEAIIPIHSHFLVGPFVDKDKALAYAEEYIEMDDIPGMPSPFEDYFMPRGTRSLKPGYNK